MNKRYLTVYNLSREKDWVLKNATDIIETREINTVWSLEFTIPMNENDMEHCQPYWYVRYGDDGQLYRFTEQTKTNDNESTVTYHCEHVIATLSDDVMYQGPYIVGNIGTYTNQVLNFILNKQTTRNWVLGTCEPRRQFEYSWENENLLAALWSVPTCFDTPYMWTFDTSSYPWRVNLVNINENADPDFYLMAKKNILRSTEDSSNLDICTRLYGLGEGEGINQLTIKSVNGGLPYVQSSPEIIAKYGIVSRIFVDRRFQYPETLKARMETLLHELEVPTMTREFEIVDLYDLSPDDMYKAEVGEIVLLKDDNTKVYITKTVKNWSIPGDMKLTFATKATDMSTSIADLADRQRIEQVYSQGATQVYSFSFFGNATTQYPLDGYVYFPEDLKYLNEVKLKIKMNPFRSYSQAAANIEATVSSTTKKAAETKTTTQQAASTPTTSQAAATIGSTSEKAKESSSTANGSVEGSSSTSSVSISGTGTTETFWAPSSSSVRVAGSTGANYGNEDTHYHDYEISVGIPYDNLSHSHTVNLENIGEHSHKFELPSHTHSFEIPAHSHNVTVPEHKHTVTIPAHSHQVTIPEHSHQVTIPSHGHEITPGIFERGNPTQADVLINDKLKFRITTSDTEVDITQYLLSNGAVPRGQWIKISVKPNDLAYISVFGNTFAFIQSYTGGNY